MKECRPLANVQYKQNMLHNECKNEKEREWQNNTS